ncbi:hepatocyte growth factor activator [Rhinophrynus dorsalis]
MTAAKSETFVKSTDKASTNKDSPKDGKKCKFPFRYRGRMHATCIPSVDRFKFWCATTNNFDRDREWGYCVDASSTETEKCFDEDHYEYYDIGESWSRIHSGKVETCTCQDGMIECHRRERYTACIENPCLNGGACRLMISTGKTICGCRGNYVGKYCNIDVRQQCYDYDNASGYRGIEKKSKSGQSCLPWNSEMLYEEIHIGWKTDFALKGLGSHSYCRSPDDDETSPWCYLIDEEHLSWEHCNISICIGKGRKVPAQEEDAVLLSKPKCGKKHEKRVVSRGRIIGGLTALPGSHPWLAAIYIGNYFCAGSLIQPCWVVSAAHCFADSPPKSSIRVVLGQHFYNRTTADTQTFEIERYIFYDKYSIFKRTEHDIALVKLKKVNNYCAKKTQFVQPICLPEDGISFPDGYMCQISGWGRLFEDATDYSSVLQEAGVPLVPDNKCSSPEVYGADISDNMFCAGYFECTKDACQGDSGGPLACEQDKTFYLYGIVSWGDGCGRLNKPGVYTRVSNYVDWIIRRTTPKPKTN